jgi:hypothetical protein
MMRSLLLLLLVSTCSAQSWTEYGSFYGVPNYSQELLTGIFTGDSPNNTPIPLSPAGVWITVNLLRSASNPRGIPSWATAVTLEGVMIITGGPQNVIYGLTVALRRTGSAVNAPYTMQTSCVGPNVGVRAPAFGIVPVANGCFDYQWQTQPAEGSLPRWPGGPSYGINFAVAGYYGPPGKSP